MFHVRSPCGCAGNDHLDEHIHRVEHRRRDLSFLGSLNSQGLFRFDDSIPPFPTRSHATAGLRPGGRELVRAGRRRRDRWELGHSARSYDEVERARFAPETDNWCSGRTWKTRSLGAPLQSTRGSETTAPPAPDAGGAFCIQSLFENSKPQFIHGFIVRPRRTTLE